MFGFHLHLVHPIGRVLPVELVYLQRVFLFINHKPKQSITTLFVLFLAASFRIFSIGLGFLLDLLDLLDLFPSPSVFPSLFLSLHLFLSSTSVKILGDS